MMRWADPAPISPKAAVGIVSICFGTASSVVIAAALVAAGAQRREGMHKRSDAVLCSWLMLASWGLAVALHSADGQVVELTFRLLALFMGLLSIGLYQSHPAVWKLLLAGTFLVEELIYLQYDAARSPSVGITTVRQVELRLNQCFGAQLCIIGSGSAIYGAKRLHRAIFSKLLPVPSVRHRHRSLAHGRQAKVRFRGQ